MTSTSPTDTTSAGRATGAPLGRARPRLGLLLDSLSYNYQKEILQGAHEEAVRSHVDLCCFSGGAIVGDGRGGRASIYELARHANVDGLIVASSTMANKIGRASFQEFLRRFDAIPICSIGAELEEIPSLIIDNLTGVREVTSHLIDVHKCSRIAMVTGPSVNTESQQRFAGYRAALASRGMPFVEELIVVGDFTHRCGVEAVQRLFAEGKGPDAIVAANDWTALGILEALEQRGLRVPRDVAVIGFDDIDEARFTAPSLSTIRQPIRELGARAARSVLARLAGEGMPLSSSLPTSIQLRQSCGCLDGSTSGWTPQPRRSPHSLTEFGDDLRELARTLAPVLPQADGADDASRDNRERALQLVVALHADLRQGTSDELIAALDRLLDGTASWGNVHAWHGTLAFLRAQVADFVAPPSPEGMHLERLVERAHIVISAAAERGQGRRRLEQENLMRTLQQTTAALLAAVDVSSLAKALGESLPKVGIPACTVVLQPADGGAPLSESDLPRGELVVAYDQGLLPPEPRSLTGAELLVPATFPSQRRSTVLQPLLVGQEVLGFCTLEIGPLDGTVYEVVCEQIGAAVKGVQLFRAVVDEVTKREQAERARLESEMRVATRIQTGILPKTTSASGLQIAATMLPATEVGGDYFDVLPFEGGCWLGIGDVAGHGLPTGLVMLMIQSVVAATTRCRNDAQVGNVWATVNNVLYDNLKRLQQDEYATLSLIRYEANGQLRWAGAHEELLVYRHATRRCETLPLVGTWAGIRSYNNGRIPEASSTLHPGDVLVLYTDGVTEAMDQDKQQFGMDRLCQAVEEVGELGVNEIRDHLIARVRAWQNSQFDDITVVVIRQGEHTV